MRTGIVLVLLSVASVVACSGGGSDGTTTGDSGVSSEGDSSSSGSDSSTPGTDGSASDTGGGGGDTSTASDAAPPVPFCQMSCNAPSDCASPSDAFDTDNYACDAHLCRWLGCFTDAECTSSFASSAYACRTIDGVATKTCVHTCAAAADCSTGSAAFDADNYACDPGGTCRYLGCNADDECKSSFASPAYVCRAVPIPGGLGPFPSGAKNCVKSCSTANDCSSASDAFDADNYACTDGVCQYIGCHTDAECKSSFMKSNYVCR